jgi:hypothetical protein
MRGRLHQNFDLHNAVPAGSERGFALVFTVVFAPRSLAPLNRLWFRFGLLLGRVVSPVAMALSFYGTVVPTGLVMRLRFDPEVASSRIERDPPGLALDSFGRQF